MIASPQSKYFLLEEGDIIEIGDEYYSPHDDLWLKVNDGTGVCPRCESINIGLNPNKTDAANTMHCDDCFNYFERANFPDAFIGYGFNPQESKPVRRINPNKLVNQKINIRYTIK